MNESCRYGHEVTQGGVPTNGLVTRQSVRRGDDDDDDGNKDMNAGPEVEKNPGQLMTRDLPLMGVSLKSSVPSR